MIKRGVLACLLMGAFKLSLAGAAFISSETTTFQQLLDNFSKLSKTNLPGTPVKQQALPVPYDYLLTQPLMTIGIEQYYQRTPIVQPIYAVHDEETNQYSRISIMLLDRKKSRNKPNVAREEREDVVVAAAVITINFNEIPEKMRRAVLNTQIPFGKLLVLHHVKTTNQDRAYFSLRCNKPLAALTHCKLNRKIFGRINTLVKADNKQWLARVVEILPGIQKNKVDFTSTN